MKSKTLAVLILAVFAGAFVSFSIQKANEPKDFSQIQLVYENDASVCRYYYDSLSDNAKIAYTLILPELYNFSEKIEIPNITYDEFDEIMYALSYDNPELFFLGSSSRIEAGTKSSYYCPTYICTQQEYEEKKAELDKAVNKALSEINSNADEYKKELFVHDYLCDICKYEEGESNSENTSVYNALVTGEAVCEGYSKATKLLLDRLNVRNYLVTGDSVDDDGKKIGHMWNVVTVNGENYHLDVTWDDMDAEDLKAFSHMYFNVTDKVIEKNHLNMMPENNNCTAVTYNYYNANGMYFSYYDNTARQKIINEIYNCFKNGTNICCFCFDNKESYDLAYESLIENDGMDKLFYDVRRQHSDINYKAVNYLFDENVCAFECAFS